MKGMFKTVIIAVVAFVGGVVLSDSIKPILSKLPIVGKMIGGSTNQENA